MTKNRYQVTASYSNDAYDAYILYETKSKKPDVSLAKALFERAISDSAKQRFAGAVDAENRLRSLWLAYCNFIVRSSFFVQLV